MEYITTIILGTTAGLCARVYMLRRDYRQYPSYPQGWAIHLFIGFIGAALGSVLVPSFIEKEFSAVSFLLLAASQFREVRSIERETLSNMESNELVQRGNSYIEGIARVFEARNYLAIWTAMAVAIVSELLKFSLGWRILGSAVVALVVILLLSQAMRGQCIRDIAHIEVKKIEFDGPILVVDGVSMMNVGLEAARKRYVECGLGAAIIPKDANAKATLANIGQMQAIAHDVSSMIGVYMDVGEQEYTPLVRRDPDSGKLVLSIIPAHNDKKAFVEAIARVPVLEGAIRKPLQSKAGQMLK